MLTCRFLFCLYTHTSLWLEQVYAISHGYHAHVKVALAWTLTPGCCYRWIGFNLLCHCIVLCQNAGVLFPVKITHLSCHTVVAAGHGQVHMLQMLLCHFLIDEVADFLCLHQHHFFCNWPLSLAIGLLDPLVFTLSGLYSFCQMSGILGEWWVLSWMVYRPQVIKTYKSNSERFQIQTVLPKRWNTCSFETEF